MNFEVIFWCKLTLMKRRGHSRGSLHILVLINWLSIKAVKCNEENKEGQNSKILTFHFEGCMQTELMNGLTLNPFSDRFSCKKLQTDQSKIGK